MQKLKKEKSAALVLSSGGARGMAHIGVIEELLKNNIRITSIAGSSIGSLVGGIYASGKLDEYTHWMKSLSRFDVVKLMDFAISKKGLVKGDKVMNELEKFVSDKNIEDLDIPFTAIATDFNTGKEVVFNKGSLIEAIRASVAIPTIFFPLEKDGHELLDGGLVNPLPLNRVARNKNDILIAVNLNSSIPYKKPVFTDEHQHAEPEYLKKMKAINKRWAKIFTNDKVKKKKYGFYKHLTGSFIIMQNKLSEITLDKYPPDILINISRDACDTLEFYKAHEMIEYGRVSFRQNFDSGE